MPITPLPTPGPAVTDSRADFSAHAFALAAALPTLVTDINATETNINAKEASAAGSAAVAAASADSALAAAQAAGAIAWVSGTTYAVGDLRYSPTNYQSYRRKTAGAGTIDPSADSTNWAQIGIIAATQAEVEAATSNAVALTAANANWHPGIAKAWIRCSDAGTIQASHNITSITDNGTGDLTVTIATDFSSANYAVIGSVASSSGVLRIGAQTVGSFGATYVSLANPSFNSDPGTYFFACFGDQ